MEVDKIEECGEAVSISIYEELKKQVLDTQSLVQNLKDLSEGFINNELIPDIADYFSCPKECIILESIKNPDILDSYIIHHLIFGIVIQMDDIQKEVKLKNPLICKYPVETTTGRPMVDYISLNGNSHIFDYYFDSKLLFCWLHKDIKQQIQEEILQSIAPFEFNPEGVQTIDIETP